MNPVHPPAASCGFPGVPALLLLMLAGDHVRLLNLPLHDNVLNNGCSREDERRDESRTRRPSPAFRMGIPIPNGKLGMWLFLGTEIMFFTAFIGTYIVMRMGSPGWPTDVHVTHINILLGGINTSC